MGLDPLAAPPEESARCPNCGAVAGRSFCPECGQARAHDLHVPFGEVAAEAIQETIGLESRLAATVPALLFRPGAVTADYLAGRRARYSSPLRVYLVASVVYFLAAALHPQNVRFATPADVGATSSPAERERHLDESEAALRARGRIGALFASRLHRFRSLPPDEAGQRLAAELSQLTPRVAFFLVPVLAALLALAFRRSGLYYAEHLVFALHANAVGFVLLLPGAVLDSDGARAAGALAATAHAMAALRRVHRASWGATLARGVPVALAYGVALTIGVALVWLWALLTV